MKVLRNALCIALPALMALMASCKPEPETEVNVNLAFKVTSEVTDSQIKATVKPSDGKVNYFASLVETESIKDVQKNDLAAKMMEGKDFESKLYKGDQELVFRYLESKKEYTLILFGTDGQRAGEVTLENYTTKDIEQGGGDVTFVIEVTDITSTSATVTVTPSDLNVDYYMNNLPKSELQMGGQTMSERDFIAYFGQDPYIESKTYKGKQTIALEKLAPGLSYIIACYDLNQTEHVTFKEYKTEQREITGDNFTIDNVVPATNGVTFDVTPKDNEQFYCTWITQKSTFEKFEPEAYILGVYRALNNIAIEKSQTLSDYVKTIAKQGKASWTNFDGDLKPETEYVIVAFYVDPENNDQLNVYDWSYTKEEFTTTKATAELDIIIGKITKIEAIDMETANVYVHLKSVGAKECRAGAKTVTEIHDEIEAGYNPESWADSYISWRANVSVSDIQTEEGADMVIPVIYDATQDMYLIVRVKSEQGNTVTKYVPLEVTE